MILSFPELPLKKALFTLHHKLLTWPPNLIYFKRVLSHKGAAPPPPPLPVVVFDPDPQRPGLRETLDLNLVDPQPPDLPATPG